MAPAIRACASAWPIARATAPRPDACRMMGAACLRVSERAAHWLSQDSSNHSGWLSQACLLARPGPPDRGPGFMLGSYWTLCVAFGRRERLLQSMAPPAAPAIRPARREPRPSQSSRLVFAPTLTAAPT
jgi:hypothetical protein